MMEMKMGIQEAPFQVKTTHNRGHTPEEVAELCVNKLISVGDETHPAIQAQARAFREQILALVTHYIKMGVEQDRATICSELTNSGHEDLANIIRRL